MAAAPPVNRIQNLPNKFLSPQGWKHPTAARNIDRLAGDRFAPFLKYCTVFGPALHSIQPETSQKPWGCDHAQTVHIRPGARQSADTCRGARLPVQCP